MNDNDSPQEEHYLMPFLSTRLPELGLDVELYAPYVIGVFSNEQDSSVNDDTIDEEEVDAVIELLQASSETHSDDAQAWQQLKTDLVEKFNDHVKQQAQILEQQRLALHEKEHERLQHDIQLAQQQQPHESSKSTSIEMDEQKRALVERFGYEQDDDTLDDAATDANKKKNPTTTDTTISNKEVAAKTHLDKARQQRATQKTTKRQEQEATKQAKLQKQAQKEARRKRATKSERRR